jgi:hypothetical protein
MFSAEMEFCKIGFRNFRRLQRQELGQRSGGGLSSRRRPPFLETSQFGLGRNAESTVGGQLDCVEKSQRIHDPFFLQFVLASNQV